MLLGFQSRTKWNNLIRLEIKNEVVFKNETDRNQWPIAKIVWREKRTTWEMFEARSCLSVHLTQIDNAVHYLATLANKLMMLIESNDWKLDIWFAQFPAMKSLMYDSLDVLYTTSGEPFVKNHCKYRLWTEFASLIE